MINRKLIDKLEVARVPFGYVKHPLLTNKERQRNKIRQEIEHLDELTEKYLQSYLRKRSKLWQSLW